MNWSHKNIEEWFLTPWVVPILLVLGISTGVLVGGGWPTQKISWSLAIAVLSLNIGAIAAICRKTHNNVNNLPSVSSYRIVIGEQEIIELCANLRGNKSERRRISAIHSYKWDIGDTNWEGELKDLRERPGLFITRLVNAKEVKESDIATLQRNASEFSQEERKYEILDCDVKYVECYLAEVQPRRGKPFQEGVLILNNPGLAFLADPVAFYFSSKYGGDAESALVAIKAWFDKIKLSNGDVRSLS